MNGAVRFVGIAAAGCAMLMLTTGCTSSRHAGTPAPSVALSAPATSTAATATTSTVASATASTNSVTAATTAPSSGVLHADLSDAGHTVELASGQRLEITLASTFWQFANVSGAVVREDASPRVLASPTGCVPGGGCGAVAVTFVAIGRGSVDVTAHRSVCGEAMGCTAKTGDFVLHVVVP